MFVECSEMYIQDQEPVNGQISFSYQAVVLFIATSQGLDKNSQHMDPTTPINVIFDMLQFTTGHFTLDALIISFSSHA